MRGPVAVFLVSALASGSTGSCKICPDLMCPDGMTACAGVGADGCPGCVDLAADENHCGMCGLACDTAAGMRCIEKQCECPGQMTSCGGVCTETATDTANCGSCGNVCEPGFTCHAGACGDDLCPPPGTRCDGSCIDVSSDDNNCGACNVGCAVDMGFSCSDGRCVCVSPHLTGCEGECVDTSTDPRHCGECSNACGSQDCDGDGEPDDGMCVGGACMALCGDPLCACDGACVDPRSSSDHCGSCGHACDTAHGYMCISGECRCAPQTLDCGGYCAMTAGDPNNCGGCGITCLSGSCSGGRCEGDAGVVYPDAGADTGMDLHSSD